MHALLRLIATCLLLLPVIGGAATPQAVKARLLDTLHQGESETQEQFLIRTAMRVRARTQETGAEVCGSFCAQPGGNQAIMLFTSDSTVSCRVLRGCPLGDYMPAGTDIHSHPANWKMTLSEAEATRMNQGRRMFKKKGGDAMRFSPRRFSKDDYSFGPGYLVYDDELWHQAGKGTERILWTLPEEPRPASP